MRNWVRGLLPAGTAAAAMLAVMLGGGAPARAADDPG
ncbi:MAG: hypothetical protein JWL84_5286, partial [Rhodospirillales bacterium]|nr:hypothetical protein [Rhodospirillales bacterium]